MTPVTTPWTLGQRAGGVLHTAARRVEAAVAAAQSARRRLVDAPALVVEPAAALENREYESPWVRRAHLELADFGDVGVFHAVVYPRRRAPILSMDLVRVRDRVTFAVADPCCPPGVEMPDAYALAVRALRRWTCPRGLPGTVTRRDDLPRWAADIFSDEFLLLRPEGPDGVCAAAHYLAGLAKLHMQWLPRMSAGGGDGDDEAALAAQAEYGACQRRNERTRRVLVRALGPERADAYLRYMFDL